MKNQETSMMTSEMIKHIYAEAKFRYSKRKFLPWIDLEDFQQIAWMYINKTLSKKPENQSFEDWVAHKLYYEAMKYHRSQLAEPGAPLAMCPNTKKPRTTPLKIQVGVLTSLSQYSNTTGEFEMAVPNPEKEYDLDLHTPSIPINVQNKLLITEKNLVEYLLKGYSLSDIAKDDRLYTNVIQWSHKDIKSKNATTLYRGRVGTLSAKFKKILAKLQSEKIVDGDDRETQAYIEHLLEAKHTSHGRFGVVKNLNRTAKGFKRK